MPSAQPPPTVERFNTRCAVWYWGTPCRVTITPGSVEVTAWRITTLGLRIGVRQQRNPLIFVVRSRLPPWLPRIELVDDDSGDRLYLAPFFGDYRRITSALERAGFLIRERRVWYAPA